MSQSPSPKLGGARAWLIWTLAALAFGYAFFQRVAPSVMVSDLMGEFAIGGAVLGTLSALYFYPYVLLQIPLGTLLDRLGVRVLLSSALMIAALGSALFAGAETLQMAYLGRIFIGVGSAVGFLSSLALAGKWFPPERFAFLTGLVMFFAMTSGMLAQAPLALFVEKFGWRASQWGLGIFGALLALLVLLLVRNAPSEVSGSEKQYRQSWGDMKAGLLRAAGTLEVWKIALVAAAMSGPMLTLGGLWGTPYMIVTYGLAKSDAAFLVSLMLLAWAIGAPLAGWLSGRVGRRKVFLVGGSALLVVAMGLLVFVPQLPIWATVGLMMISGGSGAAMATTFALAQANTPAEISGSVAGIINSITVASGAVLQPVVGLVLDFLWGGEFENGARLYLPSDYRMGFISVFVLALAGLLVALRLKENIRPTLLNL